MARGHGVILSSIWSDPDFCALDGAAQRLYMQLVSQPNLTHAGTLSITVRRWANQTTGETPQTITAALRVLSESRFVVVDWNTEELLIRTLIRNDKVFKQPRVFQVAADEVRALSSGRLRIEVRRELERLPLEEVSDKATKDGSPSPRRQVASIVEDLLSILPDTPSDTPPDTPAHTPGDTHPEGYAQGSPRTRALSPSPAPSPSPAVSDGADFAAASNAQTILAEHIDSCRKRPPDRVIGHLSREIKNLVDEGIEADDIRAGLDILREKGLNPASLPSTVNQAMNAGRKPNAGNLTPRNAQNLAVVQLFADMESRGEIA